MARCLAELFKVSSNFKPLMNSHTPKSLSTHTRDNKKMLSKVIDNDKAVLYETHSWYIENPNLIACIMR